MTAQASRALLLAALAALLLSTVWSLRTPPAPGSDRYDYAGCAFNAAQGRGLRPLVDYPLRFAFAGAAELPAPNLTRPPLWPILLTPLVRAGAGDAAGVVLAAVCAGALVGLMGLAAGQTFGAGAGSAAAVALSASFVVTRAIWGGGPELAMALVAYALWTWSPREQGRLAHVACGSLYGALPLLHPLGWVVAGLAAGARGGRYARRQAGWLLLGGVLVAVPWHVQMWVLAGSPAAYVQAQAELAKAVLDPAGMGPYRGLSPVPTFAVIAHHPAATVAAWWANTRHLATHLDQWLAWPLLALALLGARVSPRLALRDALLMLAAGLAVALWSREARLLVPLLPVACSWVGAGVVGLSGRWRGAPAVLTVLVLSTAPWVVPMGRALRPGAELAGVPAEQRAPSQRLLRALQDAGDSSAPFFTDSAVLAWRARRQAVLVPQTPALIDVLRGQPALRRARVVALTAGRTSLWTAGAQQQWDAALAAATIVDELPDGALVVRLEGSPPSRRPEPGADAHAPARDAWIPQTP